ncbi:MAG: TlyA family RNA methyltransferase [Candidatus Sericytochromatia bacterium]|nr:TlyA family RNA methyltransferase [Candidatus Sericytochromatia bacterium]
MAKLRLDLLIIEKNLFDSRQKAQAAIMEGIVMVGNKIINKPGTLINQDEEITLTRPLEEKYVSRGGLKLEKAIIDFKPEIKDKIFLDIGASTGGFTDCLLQNEAKFVYAVDVGYGQIDWSIRQDPRVKVIERCNARYLEPEQLYQESEKAQAAVIDVSFISLSKIIPNLMNLLTTDFFIMSLVKPQFEAGRDKVKKGIVLSPDTHEEVIFNLKKFLETINLKLNSLTYSPVKGPSGNIEFLAYITPNNSSISDENIKNLVKKAHHEL